MLMSVHPAVFLRDWGFGDFQSLRLSPGGHPVQPIEASHLGGDVELIEFLDGDTRGFARARCVVTSEIERSVACGGFAAEFYLLKNGYAERGCDDERDISQIVFHNATGDREDFWGRKLGRDEEFSKAEDEAFMHHAIGVAPIFDQYLPRMQELVRELRDTRRVEGRRVKEVLRIGNLR
jgi:hypothetical protein